MKKTEHVSAEFFFVPCKTAEEWLQKNLTNKNGTYQNRKLKERIVEKYYRKMKRGEWNERNGETIKFDADGNMIDGQHRLTAQVRACVDLWYLVAFNCSRDAFVTIDEGANRSSADILSMVGERNANVLASAITLHIKYNKGGMLETSGMSNLDVRNEVNGQTEQTWRDSVACAVSARGPKGFLAPSLASWIHYEITQRHGKETADSFVESVLRGDGKMSPAIVELRRKLVENLAATRRASRTAVAAWIVKSWNAHFNNQRIAKGGLRFKERSTRDASGRVTCPVEQFPTIM
jgi:hypothetical protein